MGTKPSAWVPSSATRTPHITATGPGRLAVDRFFRWGTGGWPQAAFALGLGGIAAAITLSL